MKYQTARKLYRVEREARVTATYFVMARNLEEAKNADVPRFARLRFWSFGSARTERAYKTGGPTDYSKSGAEAVDYTGDAAAGTASQTIGGSHLRLTQHLDELTISNSRPPEIVTSETAASSGGNRA